MQIDIKRHARVDRNLNTLTEKFVFANYDIRKARSLFYPVMAGTTVRDPNYRCRRTWEDPYTPYLYIFEYVASGRGYIECEGKKYTVNAGDMYIVNHNTVTNIYSDPNDPFEKMWLNVCGRYVTSLMYAYNICEPVFILHMDARNYMKRIHDVLTDYDFQYATQNDLKIMHTMLDLFDGIKSVQSTNTLKYKSATVEEIADYISQNIMSNTLTVKGLSSIFFISDRTLLRMFMKRFGKTPIEYISDQKMLQAQYLLSTTGITVEKISELLGYSSVGYFRKRFFEFCSQTPAQYRRENRLRIEK